MTGLVTTRAVRDFGFHPGEDDVRVFVTEPGGVLRLGDDVYVSAGRYGDVILWHYALKSESSGSLKGLWRAGGRELAGTGG